MLRHAVVFTSCEIHIFAPKTQLIPSRPAFYHYTHTKVRDPQTKQKTKQAEVKKRHSLPPFPHSRQVDQSINQSVSLFHRSMSKISLPLLLLRRQPIGRLTQKDRHISQIDTEALSQPLAFAASPSLAVEPGSRGAAETALAVPLPRQAARVAVAEVAGVAADGAGAVGLLLLLVWVLLLLLLVLVLLVLLLLLLGVEVLVLWVGEAVALVRVLGFGADSAAAGGDGEGVGEDGGQAVGAAGWAKSVVVVACSSRSLEFAQTGCAGALGLRGVGGGVVGVEVA